MWPDLIVSIRWLQLEFPVAITKLIKMALIMNVAANSNDQYGCLASGPLLLL